MTFLQKFLLANISCKILDRGYMQCYFYCHFSIIFFKNISNPPKCTCLLYGRETTLISDWKFKNFLQRIFEGLLIVRRISRLKSNLNLKQYIMTIQTIMWLINHISTIFLHKYCQLQKNENAKTPINIAYISTSFYHVISEYENIKVENHRKL